MKQYGKWLILAFLWGVIFSLRAVMYPDGNYELTGLVINIGFDILPACNQMTILKLLEAMVPYFVFMITFGTFIYQHFCWSSPYIFTRCSNRIKWLHSELCQLFFYAAGYLLCMIAGRLVPYLLFSNLKVDWTGVQMLAVLFGILVMWLFSSALLCNTLSIIKSGVWGTIATLVINMCGVAALIFVNTNDFTAQEQRKLCWNYWAHLVFGWHSFDKQSVEGMDQLGAGLVFWQSYLYLGVIVVLLILFSVYVVQRKDIIGNPEAK